MKFTLEIDMTGPPFTADPNAELESCLRQVAMNVGRAGSPVILDSNGNTVGRWGVFEPSEDPAPGPTPDQRLTLWYYATDLAERWLKTDDAAGLTDLPPLIVTHAKAYGWQLTDAQIQEIASEAYGDAQTRLGIE